MCRVRLPLDEGMRYVKNFFGDRKNLCAALRLLKTGAACGFFGHLIRDYIETVTVTVTVNLKGGYGMPPTGLHLYFI